MNIDLQILREEISRDRHLAAAAAGMITDLIPLAEIPTEPLECLSEMIRQELQDRDLRETKAKQPLLPF